jgi:Carboxypeptidase regulatory-like domain
MRLFKNFVGFAAVAFATTLVWPAQAYEETAVENGGSIAGTIVYQGSVPMRKIIPTKDTEVCGGIREEPEIIVDAAKGVKDAVVYLAKVEKGKAWPAPEGPPKLNNVKCVFEPHVQVIPAGELVVTNQDPILHNTHGFYGKRTAFNMALPNKGQEIPAELKRDGTVRIECDAHGWMLGWVYVVENPYYAVTGEDGKFTIGDVPPGDYTLVATHEFTGPMEVPITVKAGEAATVPIELKKK